MRFYLRIFIPLFIMAIFSCKQESLFTSRKYTKGRYFEGIAKKGNPKNHNHIKTDNGNQELLADAGNNLNEIKKENENTAELKENQLDKIAQEKSSMKRVKISPAQIIKFHPSKELQKAFQRLNKNTKKSSSDADDSIQILPVVAFALGVVALLTQIAAFVLSIALIEVSPVFIVGFVLGIAAVVMGIIGLIKSKDSSVGANKVFSVLGISIGGGSLILGIVLLFYAFIVVSLLSEI